MMLFFQKQSITAPDMIFVKTFKLTDIEANTFCPKGRNLRHIKYRDSVKSEEKFAPLQQYHPYTRGLVFYTPSSMFTVYSIQNTINLFGVIFYTPLPFLCIQKNINNLH